MRSEWIRSAAWLWLASLATGASAQQSGPPAPQDFSAPGLSAQPSIVSAPPAGMLETQGGPALVAPQVGSPSVGSLQLGSPQPEVAVDGGDAWLLRRLEAVEAELTALRTAAAANDSSDFVDSSDPVLQGCPECSLPQCGGACGATNDEKAKFPQVRISGVFMLDGGRYHQDDRNRATLGDIEDGLGFRRARLAATGKVTEQTNYIMEFDFAQAQPRFVDVWMEFENTPLGKLRIGRFRQPFGMTDLTSIRDLPFLERPLPISLSPFRQTGIMLGDTAWDDSLTWAVSGFRYLGDSYGNVYGDDGGYGLASRLTSVLVDHGDEGLVHGGVGYSYADPARDRVQFAATNEFFAAQNPELGPGALDVLPLVSVPPFVNTGALPTADIHFFNIEAAYARRNFVVQSEARWAEVELLDGTSNTFPGAYAYVRYVLTGETIPYNRGAGVFTRVAPRNPVDLTRGCWGAWEVAVRASYIDLNGSGLPGPGRRLTDTTLGLNWYVNDFTKFQLNWIHADLDDPDQGASDASTVAFRGQLDF